MFDIEREMFVALCTADVGRIKTEDIVCRSRAAMSSLWAMDHVHWWCIEVCGQNVCVTYTELYSPTWRKVEWPLESLTYENAVVMDVMLS